MTESLGQHYLEDSIASLRAYKQMAEKALDQLKDEEFFRTLDEEGNSVAVIMKHMAGNMSSRWTDFLTTDGEKPNRNRDMEFVIDPNTTVKDLRDYWERGWQCVFAVLEPLGGDDLMTKVMIRGEEHTVAQAINRQLMHYANHIGQIIFLAKHFHAADWETLSIARNRSAELKFAGGQDLASANLSKNARQFRVAALAHVNVTVPAEKEDAAKSFYEKVLGLRQIPKPPGTRQNVGAWFELGGVQLHLSVEKSGDSSASDRHVCYVVSDTAQAEQHLRDAGTEIISDPHSIPGVKRFYVRDPGGNLIEITEA